MYPEGNPNSEGESPTLNKVFAFITEFNENAAIFLRAVDMLLGLYGMLPRPDSVGTGSPLYPETNLSTEDVPEGTVERGAETLPEPFDPFQLFEDVASLKAMLEEAGLDAGEEEAGMTVFDAAVENAVRRAMGMDEVAEKPEWMPDFMWDMGQNLFGQSLTEKPEDMSDEEWAALTGVWDTGQKAFGVDENPLEQMQMDVDDLKTTVPGIEADITRVDTAAGLAQGTANEAKGAANSALSAASQALSAAEDAKRIAESAQAAAAAAGGTRPGADSPGVDRPPQGMPAPTRD